MGQVLYQKERNLGFEVEIWLKQTGALYFEELGAVQFEDLGAHEEEGGFVIFHGGSKISPLVT